MEGRYKLVYGELTRARAWAQLHSGSPYIWSKLEATIHLERHGQLVAAAGYTDYIAGASISGHIVAQRLNRAFVEAILFYPFGQLGVRRLSALIPGSNARVKRFVEHIGFTHEATLKHIFPNDDLLVYRLLREEWHG